MEKSLIEILKNYLQHLISNLVINKQLNKEELENLLLIIYNEKKIKENDEEISSLIFTILSLHSNLLKDIKVCSDDLVENEYQECTVIEKILNSYSFLGNETAWSNLKEELNEKNAAQSLLNLLNERNKL